MFSFSPETGAPTDKKPLGNDVILEYDKSDKSYTITYTKGNKEKQVVKLLYINRTRFDCVRYKDSAGNILVLWPTHEGCNTVFFSYEKSVDGKVDVGLYIKNIELIK